MKMLSVVLWFMLVALLMGYNIQVTRMVGIEVQTATVARMQRVVIEENKRIMAARELVQAPALISDSAEKKFGYELLSIDDIIYVDAQE